MNQKEKEKYFINKFIKLYQHLEGYCIEPDESPDFIATSILQETVGIEITELLNGKRNGEKFAPAQRYSLEDKIVYRARDIFIEKYSIALNVSIAFCDQFKCSSYDVDKIAKEISDFVHRQISQRNLSKDFHFTVDWDMPRHCEYIIIAYFPNITQSIWYSAKGMLLPNVEINELEKCIGRKEGKLIFYKEKCVNVYLLIIEGLVSYSWYDSFEEVSNHTFRTNFDKVFVLRNFTERLIELITAPKGNITTTLTTTTNKKTLIDD